ncbi:hypothetical protein DSM106972_000490 [Dulcicalothrix desertica PCC 7102]|uniref:Uncharacterized protein n=2 Tax=Dulcicalothrix desertica TaxID=32056 RepID=A0A433VU48_9CYAN|nr:hypothetical protein DSM106972_000490 [Dulcicalothrix desertica PCC 7102]
MVLGSIMTVNSLPHGQGNRHLPKSKDKRIKLQNVQEKMYSFLLRIVKSWQPEEVLRVFKRSFIDCLDSEASKSSLGLYIVFLEHSEQEFRNTIKRCCYILINNWESTRRNKYIRELVELIGNYKLQVTPNTPSKIKIARTWLDNFLKSTDYQELQLFAHRHDEQVKGHWVNRYSSYLLLAQSLNEDNPKEQKEAARKLSKVLKEKYKFELAMYIARSQSQACVPTSSITTRYRNPSILGDNVLRLIKTIVLKKGVFSYENIANIFIKQVQNQSFLDFKISLQKYLIFSVQQQDFVETLKQQLADKLDLWKQEYHERTINKDFVLRTCNRVIDCLTTENGREPSTLFIMLLSQGNPLTLVVVLLKIVLISKNSRNHLDMKIADLIRYYDKYPEDECKWVINFIEIFNITFAIYAENVEYNLIMMEQEKAVHENENKNQNNDLDAYRVFSQLKA